MFKPVKFPLYDCILLCVLQVAVVVAGPLFVGSRETSTFGRPVATPLRGFHTPPSYSLQKWLGQFKDTSGMGLRDSTLENDPASLKKTQENSYNFRNSAWENVNNARNGFVDFWASRTARVFDSSKQLVVSGKDTAGRDATRAINSHRPNVRVVRQVPEVNTIGGSGDQGKVKDTAQSNKSEDKDVNRDASRNDIPVANSETTPSNTIPGIPVTGTVQDTAASPQRPVDPENMTLHSAADPAQLIEESNVTRRSNTSNLNATSDSGTGSIPEENTATRDPPSNPEPTDIKTSTEPTTTQQSTTEHPATSSDDDLLSAVVSKPLAGNSRAAGSDGDSWNSTSLIISLDVEGDSMLVSWDFDPDDIRITGFEVSYRMNSREDYDSSRLGKQVRLFTLHSLHTDEDYVICVHAMVNNTVVKETCADWSENSQKVIIGIMAGTVFLVPCVAVLVWILHKDRKMKSKYAEYDKVDETPAGEEPPSKTPEAEHSHSHSSESARKHSDGKILQDTGHENPCTHLNDEKDGPKKTLTGSKKSGITKIPAQQSGSPGIRVNKPVSMATNKSTLALQTAPVSTSSSTPKDSLALSAAQLDKDNLKSKPHPNTDKAAVLGTKNGPKPVNHFPQGADNAQKSGADNSACVPLAASATADASNLQTLHSISPILEEHSDTHAVDSIVKSASGSSLTNSYDGTKL